MKDLTGRLNELENIGFYVAPDYAKITPLQIPQNIELVELLTAGEVSFEVDGVEKTFGRGTIFWHKAGEHTIYRTTAQNPYRCAVFVFSVNDTNRPISRVSFWGADAGIDEFASECLNLFHSKKLDKDVLSLYVYSTLLRQAMVNDNLSGARDYPAPLERALAYIHNKPGDKIPVEALARNSGISRPHLFKLFQKHLNSTPHQYILSQQLLRAKTLLAGTSLSIKVIAYECGFENIEVFYRRFSRENGTPPGEYRSKHLPYRFSQNSSV